MADNVILMAVGDIMLSENRGTGEMMRKCRAEAPFEKVRNLLEQADIVFGNLENSISSNGTAFPKQDPHITFRASPEAVKGLKSGKFSILSLANNHMTDYGEEAFNDTLATLREHGIDYVGAGNDLRAARKAAVLERKGIRIAFLAYSAFVMFATQCASRSGYGVAQYVPWRAKHDIRKACKKADIVVVSMHWGLDFVDYPLSFQMKYAREMIDCGAHLIVGHHSHCLQGIEKYNGGLIVYSLGDFVFDQPGQDTCVLRCSISKSGVEDFELIPAKISANLQPEVVNGSDGLRIQRTIESLSESYTRYDPTLADELIDEYIYWCLHVPMKARNLHALKNINSVFLVRKTMSYVARRLYAKIGSRVS
jgi:poly-gamma-glutamate synthesis protein (capsule biosynthesis protein)